MSCGNTNRNCYQKSCQRFYNNNAQALTAGGTLTLTIAGAKVVDSGVSISTEPASYEILKSGLYHVSADVAIDTITAGAVTFSAYLDGVQMPCTIKPITLVADGNAVVHTETDIAFSSCCGCVNHAITFVLASTTGAGTVTNFCSGIIKEA